MNARIERLRGQISADRTLFTVHATRLAALGPLTDEGKTAVAAWALHHAYTAIEAILERVARELEGGVPAGPEWHRDLLSGAAVDVDGVRPPVFTASVVAALHELRAFRHFSRHGYGAPFDPARVTHVAATLATLAAPVGRELQAFDGFLKQVSAESRP